MNTLRLSYSLLELWKSGKKDDAIATYLRMDNLPVTARMREGIAFDKHVEDFVIREKTLPPELGGKRLINPTPKLTETVGLPFSLALKNPMPMTLKVELDIWDAPTIYEIKNSIARDSADFANTDQLSFYFYGLKVAGYDPKRAELYRYDPTKKQYDMTIVYFSKRRFNDVHEIVTTYGPEIYEYFQKEGVI